MAAGQDPHVAMCAGLLRILHELAQVQPLLDDDDLLEDVEEYAMFDGSEIPLIDDASGLMAIQEGSTCYIDVPVQGSVVRVQATLMPSELSDQ